MPTPETVDGKIPEGFATQIGKFGFILYALLAVVNEVFDLNLSTETLILLGAALVPPTVTQVGRYAQATARERDALSPAQVTTIVDADVDEDLGDIPENAEDDPDFQKQVEAERDAPRNLS
jgi:hypothetical protein